MPKYEERSFSAVNLKIDRANAILAYGDSGVTGGSQSYNENVGGGEQPKKKKECPPGPPGPRGPAGANGGGYFLS